MDLEETQKRRELFYEIFTYDLWQVNETLSLWFPICLNAVLELDVRKAPFTFAHPYRLQISIRCSRRYGPARNIMYGTFYCVIGNRV